MCKIKYLISFEKAIGGKFYNLIHERDTTQYAVFLFRSNELSTEARELSSYHKANLVVSHIESWHHEKFCGRNVYYNINSILVEPSTSYNHIP